MTAHGTGGGTDETKSSNGLYIADILRISACVSPHLVDQLKTTRSECARVMLLNEYSLITSIFLQFCNF